MCSYTVKFSTVMQNKLLLFTLVQTDHSNYRSENYNFLRNGHVRSFINTPIWWILLSPKTTAKFLHELSCIRPEDCSFLKKF